MFEAILSQCARANICVSDKTVNLLNKNYRDTTKKIFVQ